MNVKLLLLLSFVFILGACAQKNAYNPNAEINDVLQISQKPEDFLSNNADFVLIERAKSQEMAKEFKEKFLAPWKISQSSKSNLKYLNALLQVSLANRGYAENLRKWTDENFGLLAKNASYQLAPSMAVNAITIRDTDLRLAPTDLPYYTKPENPEYGYPFDMFQNSALHIGTPIKVFHKSEDNQWFYVEKSDASGWVKAEDLGFVDTKIVELYENSQFIAIVDEQTILQNKVLNTRARLGAIFPLVGSSSGIQAAIPYKDVGLNVKISKITLSNSQASPWPLEFKTGKVAELADQLMGDLYGWGGMHGNRDCSATMQDIFTPFGIYLPRNSRYQAKVGEVFDLKDLRVSQKEDLIAKNALPFQTLLFLPGHIGLYLGQYHENHLMLHNIWGVRLNNDERHVIGKTVITTLAPGREISTVNSTLLERLESFNIITK